MKIKPSTHLHASVWLHLLLHSACRFSYACMYLSTPLLTVVPVLSCQHCKNRHRVHTVKHSPMIKLSDMYRFLLSSKFTLATHVTYIHMHMNPVNTHNVYVTDSLGVTVTMKMPITKHTCLNPTYILHAMHQVSILYTDDYGLSKVMHVCV